MNALIKDALKLVIITVVAGLVLGAVYGITKGPIADQEAKAQMEAYKTVFPKASDFKEVDGFSEEAASKIIAANENPIEGHDSDVISSAVEAVDASGEALGYIFNITTSKGYGGDIQLTVGIQSDGTVTGFLFGRIDIPLGNLYSSGFPKPKMILAGVNSLQERK